MNNRIKEIRKHFGLTQSEFGEMIGLKQNSIASVESNKRNISDRTVLSICREFNIREEWLRFGQGEMFDKIDDDFIKMSADIEKNGDDFIKEFTKMLWGLDVEELKVLQKIVKQIKNNPNL